MKHHDKDHQNRRIDHRRRPQRLHGCHQRRRPRNKGRDNGEEPHREKRRRRNRQRPLLVLGPRRPPPERLDHPRHDQRHQLRRRVWQDRARGALSQDDVEQELHQAIQSC